MKQTYNQLYAPLSEMGLIGAIILYPDQQYRITYINSEAFYNPLHRFIWRKFEHLLTRAILPDVAAVVDGSDGEITPAYLAECTQHAPIGELYEQNIRIVKDFAARRRLDSVCAKLRSRIHSDEPTPELFSGALAMVADCYTSQTKVHKIGALAQQVYNECKLRRDNPAQLSLSIPTGLASLDSGGLAFNGLPAGQVTVLAGDSGEGKSALAQTIALKAAQSSKFPLYVSLEDNARAFASRRLSGLSGLLNRQLQRRIVRDNEWQPLGKAVDALQKADIKIIDEYFPSVEEMITEIEKICSQHDVHLVVIDYLQLVNSGKGYSKQQSNIDHVYDKILAFAKKHPTIAVLVISQLRRREDKEPTKHDLYHSAKLEQGAHTILLVWNPSPSGWPRPSGGVEGEKMVDCRVIKIAKQKDGPQGVCVLGWDEKTTTFYDADVYDLKAYTSAIERKKK